MAELEKILCTDSKVEAVKKINAIIENGGGGGLEIGDIGIAPLGIDETKGKRRYLNGQLIIQEQYVQFTDKVKSAVALYPSLACTESEWQTTATMTVGGQVGKFVVDDEAGTIRLPKIIMPIQGLTDLSKLGEIVEAGLPTHTHTRGTMNITGNLVGGNANGTIDGAFVRSGDSGGTQDGVGYKESQINFNASRTWTGSTSTGNYSKSLATTDTVQQEQIQYPYFIQVATGAETEDNIINEIELNNPFSLLDYKYSEYELNNLSWLRSEGQYNSKAIYPAVYDLLLKIYNGVETKAGVSVKLTTETFTDYDFVLNTADETFRLPIKVKLASGKAVVGNGYGLGLICGAYDDIHQVRYLSETTSNYPAAGGSVTEPLKQFADYSSSGDGFTTNKVIGVSGLPVLSGLETYDKDLYLYFYVGETVQNANLINVGRIEEKLVDKVDTNAKNLTTEGKSLISGWAMPSSKYIDLTLGASGSKYTAPANGWVAISKVSTGANQTVEVGNRGSIVNTHSSANNQGLKCVIPAKKGDAFYVSYTAGGILEHFRFIYAEGEV